MNLALFEALAAEMNAHPEAFAPLGEADMAAALVVVDDAQADGSPGTTPGPVWRVGLVFEGLRCEEVTELTEAEAAAADFRLEGPRSAWLEMLDDIRTNGRATGRLTINSLALLGDRIRLKGTDPMGLDKFSRFNQTLQEFLDGASRIGVAA